MNAHLPKLRADVTLSAACLSLLLGAYLLMYVPTYLALNEHVWSVVGQGHGPVMLVLTLWLAYQRVPRLLEVLTPPSVSASAVGWAFILAALMLYVVGRSQDHRGWDAGSQLPLVAGLLLLTGGWPALRVMLMPLAFAVTVVPLPGSIVAALTGPLKQAVSFCATEILYGWGYPIARAGVTLTIGQYKLLVADACAGINSIFALEAIGVFYMSIMAHESKLRNILLAILILPISFVSNVARVIVLVLVTYYLGDEVGQGFVHEFAGIFLMATATVLTVGADRVLGVFMSGRSKK